MEYGFIIPAAGRKVLAGLLCGQTLRLTRVQVGKGKVGSLEEMAGLTDLVEPAAEATSTVPAISEEGDRVSFMVEYRSDMNGGLTEGFWLSEYGVFAQDPENPEQEVLLYYATLGEFPQYVCAYRNGANDIRRYPVTLAITAGTEVEIAYPALAFMTAEDVEEAITHAASLGGAYWIDSLRIPKSGWTQLPEAITIGPYRWQCVLDVAEAKAAHFPEAALDVASLSAAESCGLCPTMEAAAGALHFWARSRPERDLTGTYALLAKGNYRGSTAETGGSPAALPPASENTLGGIKVGEGLEMDENNRLNVTGMSRGSVASGEEISQMVEEAFHQ